MYCGWIFCVNQVSSVINHISMDCDDLMEQEWIRGLRLAGLSEEEVQQAIAQKRCKEEVSLNRMIIKMCAWKTDISADYAMTHISLSAALDGLSRRPEAIAALRSGLSGLDETCSYEQGYTEYQLTEARARATLTLALAKLLFRDDCKIEAYRYCQCIMRAYLGQTKASREMDPISPEAEECDTYIRGGEDRGSGEEIELDMDVNAEQAEDAWYLAGWIFIHGDDHTTAYRLWTDGHTACPASNVLKRQFGKRRCWDATGVVGTAYGGDLGDGEDNSELGSGLFLAKLVGSGAYGDGKFDVLTDLEAFRVVSELQRPCPARALFHANQDGRLVFRTREPVLTRGECANVVDAVQRHHSICHGGVWGTVRQSSVKTTDVAVEDVKELRPWLRTLLATRLYPLLTAAYPYLADGTRLEPERLRVHDAFIVRYSQQDESWSLPKHCDTSALSFSVALNQQNEDYVGGGTCFDEVPGSDDSHVINADAGHAVAFAGPLRHGGYPITSGERIILVLFLYIDAFPYGPYLDDYCRRYGLAGGSAEDLAAQQEKRQQMRDADGYVVYRQTTELMEMLNKPALT